MPAKPSPSVTRLPGGITNVGESSIFSDMKQSVPTLYGTYYNDFFDYTAGNWTVTATGSTTQALTAGNSGLLLITNSAADNDLVALQKNPAMLLMDPLKPCFFSCRFKVSNGTQCDFVMGMQVVDTTPLDVTDGIYFLKADDSTALSIVARKDATTGSTTVANIATVADDTFLTLGWYYDGVSKLTYSVNGAIGGAIDITNFFPDTNLTVSFALQNGDAVARTMTVDWVFISQER